MFLKEIFNKIKFWRSTDRIGPDIIWTYWRIFFRSKMFKLCEAKFLYFGKSSEIDSCPSKREELLYVPVKPLSVYFTNL